MNIADSRSSVNMKITSIYIYIYIYLFIYIYIYIYIYTGRCLVGLYNSIL